MRKLLATLAIGGALMFGAPDAAFAQEQDGLVNIMIGDIEISDINVNVAAQIVANVCANLNVAAVVGIITEIDAGDLESYQFCRIGRAGRGPELTVTQN